MSHNRVRTYTASSTWTKDPKLYSIELVIRGGGGGGSWPAGNGNGHGGGGGAAVKSPKRRIPAEELPDTVTVTVGVGGLGGNATNRNGGNGGRSAFGDILEVDGGQGATTTIRGRGGQSMLSGGDGSQAGSVGGNAPVPRYSPLAGGGGGAGGGGFTGGKSSLVNGGVSSPAFWQTVQSGGGGSTGNAGGFPAGGGGGGQAPNFAGGKGADGCVTVIEYLYDEDE